MTNINQWIEERMTDPWVLPFFDATVPESKKREALRTLMRESINLGREEQQRECALHCEQQRKEGRAQVLNEILQEYMYSRPLNKTLDYTGPTKDLVEIIKSKLI